MRPSDEDQSLRDNGDLQVDDHVQSSVVDTLVSVDSELSLEEVGVVDDNEEDDGGQGQVETVTNTVHEDFGQVPRVGSVRRQDSVEGQGHDGTVVQDGNDQNHEGREVELPDEGHQGEADDDSDGNGTGVDGVVSHTLENDSGTSDGVNDGGQSGFGQDNIGGTSSGVSSTFDGDTDVRSGQCRRIVRTITSHGAQVTESLNSLDDFKLVFGENTGESIGVHDHLVQVGVLGTGGGSILQNLGGVHVVTETQSSTGFLGDGELITSDHLDLDTEGLSVIDGLLGVGSGRVEDGEKTDKFETVALGIRGVTHDFLEGDGQGSETSSSELFDVVLKLVLDFRGLVSGAKFDDDTGHTLGSSLELASGFFSVGDLGSLVDRVEGLEVEELDALSSQCGVREGTNNTTVDGILVLSSRGVGSEQDGLVNGEGTVGLDVLLVDGELVGGQCTGLVGTQDGNTGQLFDGGDTGNDSLVLGELLSTDGEGNGQDGRHGNGDTTNEQDKDVVKTSSVLVSESGVEDEDLEQDEDTDRDQTESTDSGENHLQVTGLVIVGTDKGGGSTEEGVGTGGDDDTLGLTLFTGGTGETFITELLSLGKRFSGQGGLVHGNIDGVNQSTIRGTDITVLEGDQVSGNKVGRFDFSPDTVSLHSSLGGKRVHERLDGVTSVPLLNETDGRVDEQKQDDTDEILPIRRSALTIGKGDSDKGSTFHDP